MCVCIRSSSNGLDRRWFVDAKRKGTNIAKHCEIKYSKAKGSNINEFLKQYEPSYTVFGECRPVLDYWNHKISKLMAQNTDVALDDTEINKKALAKEFHIGLLSGKVKCIKDFRNKYSKNTDALLYLSDKKAAL